MRRSFSSHAREAQHGSAIARRLHTRVTVEYNNRASRPGLAAIARSTSDGHAPCRASDRERRRNRRMVGLASAWVAPVSLALLRLTKRALGCCARGLACSHSYWRWW